MKKEIVEGRLSATEKLPSIRGLSTHLHVSKNTVEAAYQQLLAEGYIESQPKKGYFVSQVGPSLFKTIQTKEENKFRFNPSINVQTQLPYDFHYGSIERSAFPMKQWKKWSNLAYEMEMGATQAYGEAQGEQSLREEIANYLLQARGINSTAGQIYITSGTQQSISLLCQSILASNQQVAFEEPGYNEARLMFKSHHFSIQPISLEHDGLNVKELNQTQAKIVYTTPSHQFPCGMIMPIKKRLELIQWANETGGIVIEDDYDGEYRYRGKPIPALRSLSDEIIYLGTFSKMLLPSLRISFAVLPPRMLEKLQTLNQTVPRVIQNTMSLFMKEGDWERHVRRMKTLYQKKHDLLIHSIEEHLGESVKIVGSDSGLHLLLEVHSNDTEQQLIDKAAENGVKVYPTHLYWSDPRKVHQKLIMIGFGNIENEKINKGILKLQEAWFGLREDG